ncbi:MAG: 16S rRNA (uracil(1498)-N(3))-methyltransferase [Coraliomargaritaceae bacterium]
MNLILFDTPFENVQLTADDPRAKHIRDTLRAEIGTLVFLGFANGLRARARVVDLPANGDITLEVIATEPAPTPLPIHLLIGLPRPHSARKVLFEAACLGVQRIDFFEAERGEPSYARSSLWTTDEWRDRIRLGLEQSFATQLPQVAVYPDLQTALNTYYPIPARIALDNYEAGRSLQNTLPQSADTTALALGPERGWSPNERDTLRRNGWQLAHLGPRVLRVESAVVAAVSIAASNCQLWTEPTTTEL